MGKKLRTKKQKHQVKSAVRRAQLLKRAGKGEDLFEYSVAKLGLAYERQAPIGPYYADYLIKRYKLVIELDGESHLKQVDHDARRNRFMESKGYRVVRLQDTYAIKFGFKAALFSLSVALKPEEWEQYQLWRRREFEELLDHRL